MYQNEYMQATTCNSKVVGGLKSSVNVITF